MKRRLDLKALIQTVNGLRAARSERLLGYEERALQALRSLRKAEVPQAFSMSGEQFGLFQDRSFGNELRHRLQGQHLHGAKTKLVLPAIGVLGRTPLVVYLVCDDTIGPDGKTERGFEFWYWSLARGDVQEVPVDRIADMPLLYGISSSPDLCISNLRNDLARLFDSLTEATMKAAS